MHVIWLDNKVKMLNQAFCFFIKEGHFKFVTCKNSTVDIKGIETGVYIPSLDNSVQTLSIAIKT